ncbi:SWIB complex BAF60b domain-containing protein [Euphorbia peplus]|nr:SWIB complex BAF60b domain-containing protein [Euphorbia peplus]
MVSDEELSNVIESVVLELIPHSHHLISLESLLHELQSKLGFDLSHKTDFILHHINLIRRRHSQPHLPIRPHPSSLLHHQLTPNDPFTLQHHPQFPPHFALHHHVFPQDLNFRQPQPLPSPQKKQQQPQPPPSVSQSVTIAVPSDLTPKESAPVGTKRRGGPGGLNKVCGVTPELQVVVGEPALPRTEIVRQLWAYIRKNNLQDPSNRRKIICDDALRIVFETDCTDMFKMNRLLAKHIIPLEPSKKSSQSKRLKVEAEPKAEPTKPGVEIISDPLAKFLGAEDREMTKLEVSRRVWEYIKVNRLEDPVNSMVIVCDGKLRELLGCEAISAVGVEEMLSRHYLFRGP